MAKIESYFMEALKASLENKKVDSYIKEMLIKTYIYFYENNIISKDENNDINKNIYIFIV